MIKKQTVFQAAFLVTGLNLISQLVGYAREIIVARDFGASALTDSFLVGMMIPTMVLGLLAGGIGTLIIPVYLEKKKKNADNAVLFVNQIFWIWTFLFILLTVLIYFCAPFLVHLFAFGFKTSSFTLAIQVTRYLLPYAIFFILISFFSGLYQAEHQFLLPALMILLQNLIIVGSILFFGKRFGIHSWTIGLIISSFIACLILFIGLRTRKGFFSLFSFKSIDWKEIAHFASLLIPLIISTDMAMLNNLIDRTVASTLTAGSISVLNFAGKIWFVPITMIAVPISIAIFPYFSHLAVQTTAKSMLSQNRTKIIHLNWYIIIPASIFLIVNANPIVRIVFERGVFDARAVAMTAFTVQMYSIGLFAHAANPIQIRVFYAFQNTITPLMIALGAALVNFFGDIWLAKYMGVGGIALSSTIVVIINFLFYELILERKYFSQTRTSRTEAYKILILAILLGLVNWFVLPWIQRPSQHREIIEHLGFVWILFTGSFVLISAKLKLESFTLLKGYVLRIIQRVLSR
jgi:putative peptidoglycan lipid II flippase